MTKAERDQLDALILQTLKHDGGWLQGFAPWNLMSPEDQDRYSTDQVKRALRRLVDRGIVARRYGTPHGNTKRPFYRYEGPQ